MLKEGEFPVMGVRVATNGVGIAGVSCNNGGSNCSSWGASCSNGSRNCISWGGSCNSGSNNCLLVRFEWYVSVHFSWVWPDTVHLGC